MEHPLCSRCQQLPFHSLFLGPYPPEHWKWRHGLGNLNELFTRTTCVFCNLVKRTLQTFYGERYLDSKLLQDNNHTVWLFRTPLDRTLSIDSDFDKSRNVPCCLEIGLSSPGQPGDKRAFIFREDRIRNDEFNRADALPALFAINDIGSEAQTSAITGRTVDSGQIDWGHVKSWLSLCSSSHTHAPLLDQKSTVLQLRAIHTETACVVPLPKTAPYVALSYQWGMDQKIKLKLDNKKRMETPGFFNNPLTRPLRTIAHAITVAKELSYRYLWVDALCIIQDSPDDLKQNVDSMDEVYQNADVTIVAAAGIDADHGLPGVSNAVPRTEHQMKMKINGITISNMLEVADSAIAFSRWNTRGWTYQERLLPRRLLIFTPSQVFYQCEAGCNWEEQYNINGLGPRFGFRDPRGCVDFVARDIWEVYAIAVGEFTNRALTDPRDKLRAFTGMMKFLERPYRAVFFKGLPTSLFDVALLWEPAGACDRKGFGFPSWSWAGWNGAVKYAMVDSMNNMCECTISQADIRTKTSGVSLCSTLTAEKDTPFRHHDQGEWTRRFDEETLEISYVMTDSAFQQFRYPRPVTHMVEDERVALLQERSNVLEISAKTAIFGLTDEHSPVSRMIPKTKDGCKAGRHELCYLSILDHQSRQAGAIVVDGRIVPQLGNRHHKFLALSRSTLYRIDEDPSWDPVSKTFRHWTQQPEQTEESDDDERNNAFFDKEHFSENVFWPTINVLLLSDEKEGVVERLGIGRIHVDAFERVANIETVLLG